MPVGDVETGELLNVNVTKMCLLIKTLRQYVDALDSHFDGFAYARALPPLYRAHIGYTVQLVRGRVGDV